jgi:hypothetical protein
MIRFHNLDALIGAIGALSAFQLGCATGYEDTAADDTAVHQDGLAGGGSVAEAAPLSGTFAIHNANSGKCLAIGGGSRNDGDPVIQFTCLGIPDQTWQLRNTTGDFYTIVNTNSGKCMAIGGGSRNDGDIVIQFTCLGIADQSWIVRSAGGGNYTIVNANSGKCLAIGGGSRNDGDVAIQFTCLGIPDQKWYL